jgi:hypothetical protein
LSKRFGDVPAVENLSFVARAGAVTGFAWNERRGQDDHPGVLATAAGLPATPVDALRDDVGLAARR